MRIVCIALTGLSLLAGCQTLKPPAPGDPNFAPIYPEPPKPLETVSGSLFHAPQGIALYTDEKAHRIGDIITVVLSESTQASKSNKNEQNKNTTAAITNPNILGSTPRFDLPKQVPLPSRTKNDLTLEASINGDRSFAGDATGAQSNQLTGTITVTVTQILPNGNLFVRGEKWIHINSGDEFIRLSGIVRPRDIGPDNTLESDRLADARITYSGTGAFADASKPGWLYKIFTHPIWPF